jgi:hypothetical protein
MSTTPSQYGRSLFLSALQPDSSAQLLPRVHFSKNGAPPGGAYDEDWLQQLIMNHPSLLPAADIEPAFSPLIPVCRELPCEAGFLDNLFVTPQGHIALVE